MTETMPYMRRGRRRRLLRYQLTGTVLLAAVLPYAVRAAAVDDPRLTAVLNQTFFASVIAIVVGVWLFRSVSDYPGVEASSYILPSFSIVYALVLLGLVFGRLEYNRAVLLFGYIGSLVWTYLVYSRSQRRRLRIGVIPIGAVAPLREIKAVDWEDLRHPKASVDHLDAVTIDLRADLPDDWERTLADYALAGLPVYHCKHLTESLTGRVELEHLAENSFGTLSPASAYMTLKHLVDWILAFLCCVLSLPLALPLMVAIALGSRGSPIFRQRRIGYQGKEFTVYKLRTMRSKQSGQADDDRTVAMTLKDDLRVTPLGRILRRSRIDELPQILNILRGEMSWIGPRPEAVVLSRWYEAEIPYYRYRHIVRPGITGWAQVNQGHVTEVADVTSKLHFDFYYIRNFSPWLDILIVARTISTVFTGFGAR